MKDAKGLYFGQGATGLATVIQPTQTPLDYLRDAYQQQQAVAAKRAETQLAQQKDAFALWKDMPESWQPYTEMISEGMQGIIEYSLTNPTDYRGRARMLTDLNSTASASQQVETKLNSERELIKSNSQLNDAVLFPQLYAAATTDANGNLLDPRKIDLSKVSAERFAYETVGGSVALKKDQVVTDWLKSDATATQFLQIQRGAAPGGFSSSTTTEVSNLFFTTADGHIKVKEADALVEGGLLNFARTDRGMNRFLVDETLGAIEYGKQNANDPTLMVDYTDNQGQQQSIHLGDIDFNNPDHQGAVELIMADRLKEMMTGREGGKFTRSTEYVKPASTSGSGRQPGQFSGTTQMYMSLIGASYLKPSIVGNEVRYTEWTNANGSRFVDVTPSVAGMFRQVEGLMGATGYEAIYGVFVDPESPGVLYVQFEDGGALAPGEKPALQPFNATQLQNLFFQASKNSPDIKVDDLAEDARTNGWYMDDGITIDVSKVRGDKFFSGYDVTFRGQVRRQAASTWGSRTPEVEDAFAVLDVNATAEKNNAAFATLSQVGAGHKFTFNGEEVTLVKVDRSGSYRRSVREGDEVIIEFIDANGSTKREIISYQSLKNLFERGPRTVTF